MVVSLSVLALQYSDDWLVCHPLTLLPPPPPPELMKVLKMDGETRQIILLETLLLV